MEYSITTKEYDDLRTLLYDECGISLGEHKQSLVVSRLTKRLRALDLDGFGAYYEHIRQDRSGEEFVRMMDLLSTNKTDFFREPKHFEFLRHRILPTVESRKSIRIWSSACSTGEEPYTIAITLHEAVKDPSLWNFQVLASDISTRVLAHAAQGLYAEERVQEIPGEIIKRHFLRGRGDSAGLVKVKPHLSSIIKFRRLNLMDDRFPIKAPLDLIFCRNVMIYFDRPTQERLVHKFYQHLKPGGHLFIGHSESLQWVSHGFTTIAPTIYCKPL
ncbi:MAG: protein-glutamate O-methyltransferase CheR [Nitrospira sp.]|nr:protein-glutamate O-methyltransferase CheR [Nitrospira sp.]